jgi:hypothetical protein
MSRRVGFCCACVILAFGLFPVSSFAEENPGGPAITVGGSVEGATAPDGGQSQPLTLEEIKRIVGPQNVCGAPCGLGQPKCYVSCGDAASCWHGYCIFL